MPTLEDQGEQPLTREEVRNEALKALRRAASLASTGEEKLQRQALIQVDIAATLVSIYKVETEERSGYYLRER